MNEYVVYELRILVLYTIKRSGKGWLRAGEENSWIPGIVASSSE
jgi:hypothetical protein